MRTTIAPERPGGSGRRPGALDSSQGSSAERRGVACADTAGRAACARAAKLRAREHRCWIKSRRQLAAIETPGSFATELACSARNLRVEVGDLGPLRFPISVAAAKRLCALARPAPFGRRDKTLHDARVRDTWEIGARALRLDTRVWTRTLAPHLAEIRKRRGLPERGAIKIVLDKMLVYGPGSSSRPTRTPMVYAQCPSLRAGVSE